MINSPKEWESSPWPDMECSLKCREWSPRYIITWIKQDTDQSLFV